MLSLELRAFWVVQLRRLPASPTLPRSIPNTCHHTRDLA